MLKWIGVLVGLFSSCWSAAQPLYAPHGGVFTPKGTLRVLLVFVASKDQPTSNPRFSNAVEPLSDWTCPQAAAVPDFVDVETGAAPPYLFLQEADFLKENWIQPNFSQEFYWMSNGGFRLIGEVFKDSSGQPVTVVVDPTKASRWVDMNQLAVAEMNRLHPNWDGSRFDQRQNYPSFRFDNSQTEEYPPDKILDFVVFVHRYNKHWQEQPNRAMPAWIGSGGGFADTGIRSTQRLNGYRIAEGFTMTHASGVFVHEVAHVLFNAPHIMGVNNVIGRYFDLPNAGWGVMAPISLFGGFNGWERWYSGLTELTADVEDLSEREGVGVNGAEGTGYLLRDYFTTGDVMRVAIPHSGGQYLWLEYHAQHHPQDHHPWMGKIVGVGDTIADSAPGVYAYVATTAADRSEIHTPLSPAANANGIHVLHAGGNYDYKLREDLPVLHNSWGNALHSFERIRPNPISGINALYRYPYDKNGDGVIALDQNYNKSRTEQFLPIYREAIIQDSFVNLYNGFGSYHSQRNQGYSHPIAFQDGDELSCRTNPKPLNYPVYLHKKAKRAPYQLNGLELRFERVSDKDAYLIWLKECVPVLQKPEMWAGELELPNISKDDGADLIIGRCGQLTLDESQTPNTHLANSKGTFVHPTVLRIKKGATLELEACSKLIVTNGATLIVEEGGQLILGPRARLIIAPTATLMADDKAIVQHRRAKVLNKSKPSLDK